MRLTAAGLDLVDGVVEGHLEVEREILSPLSDRQRHQLAGHLRSVLLALGDAGGAARA